MKEIFTLLLLINYIYNVQSLCSVIPNLQGETFKIFNVERNDVEVKHSTGGSVKIINECSFSVRNMTIIPSGNGVYWYGYYSANTESYPRVVAAALGSFNGQMITFTLDSDYSFKNISAMEIRSEGDSRAYGAFVIRGNITNYYKDTSHITLDFDPDTQKEINSFSSSSSHVTLYKLFNNLYMYIICICFYFFII